MYFLQSGLRFPLLDIAEGNLLKSDGTFCVINLDRIWPVLNLDWQVQHLENALEAHHGGSEIDPCIGKCHERTIEVGQICGKGHQRADSEYIDDDQVATEPENDGGANCAYQAERQKEPAADERLPDSDIAYVSSAVSKATNFRVVATKDFH